jgi:hypothetical protein
MTSKEEGVELPNQCVQHCQHGGWPISQKREVIAKRQLDREMRLESREAAHSAPKLTSRLERDGIGRGVSDIP